MEINRKVGNSIPADPEKSRNPWTDLRAKENMNKSMASAKIVKTEFNAFLYLLGSSPFFNI